MIINEKQGSDTEFLEDSDDKNICKMKTNLHQLTKQTYYKSTLNSFYKFCVVKEVFIVMFIQISLAFYFKPNDCNLMKRDYSLRSLNNINRYISYSNATDYHYQKNIGEVFYKIFPNWVIGMYLDPFIVTGYPGYPNPHFYDVMNYFDKTYLPERQAYADKHWTADGNYDSLQNSRQQYINDKNNTEQTSDGFVQYQFKQFSWSILPHTKNTTAYQYSIRPITKFEFAFRYFNTKTIPDTGRKYRVNTYNTTNLKFADKDYSLVKKRTHLLQINPYNEKATFWGIQKKIFSIFSKSQNAQFTRALDKITVKVVFYSVNLDKFMFQKMRITYKRSGVIEYDETNLCSNPYLTDVREFYTIQFVVLVILILYAIFIMRNLCFVYGLHFAKCSCKKTKTYFEEPESKEHKGLNYFATSEASVTFDNFQCCCKKKIKKPEEVENKAPSFEKIPETNKKVRRSDSFIREDKDYNRNSEIRLQFDLDKRSSYEKTLENTTKLTKNLNRFNQSFGKTNVFFTRRCCFCFKKWKRASVDIDEQMWEEKITENKPRKIENIADDDNVEFESFSEKNQKYSREIKNDKEIKETQPDAKNLLTDTKNIPENQSPTNEYKTVDPPKKKKARSFLTRLRSFFNELVSVENILELISFILFFIMLQTSELMHQESRLLDVVKYETRDSMEINSVSIDNYIIRDTFYQVGLYWKRIETILYYSFLICIQKILLYTIKNSKFFNIKFDYFQISLLICKELWPILFFMVQLVSLSGTFFHMLYGSQIQDFSTISGCFYQSQLMLINDLTILKKIPHENYYIITIFVFIWYIFIYLIIFNFFRAKVSCLYFAWRKSRLDIEKNFKMNDAYNFNINFVDDFIISIKHSFLYFRAGLYASTAVLSKIMDNKETKKIYCSKFKNKQYYDFDKSIHSKEFEAYTNLLIKKEPKYTIKMKIIVKGVRAFICTMFTLIAIATLMNSRDEDIIISPYEKFKQVLAEKHSIFYGTEAIQRFLIDGLPDFLGNDSRRLTYNAVEDVHIQTSTNHIVSSFLWQATRHQNVTNENAYKGFLPYKQISKEGDPIPPTFKDSTYKFVTQMKNTTFADRATAYSSYPTSSNAHYWNLPNDGTLIGYVPFEGSFYANFNASHRILPGNILY